MEKNQMNETKFQEMNKKYAKNCEGKGQAQISDKIIKTKNKNKNRITKTSTTKNLKALIRKKILVICEMIRESLGH